MPEPGRTDRELLRSWKAIAAHLGVDVRTVHRWHHKTPLPIHRPLEGHGQPSIYTDELDEWLTRKQAKRPGSPGLLRRRATRVAIVATAGALLVLAAAIVTNSAQACRSVNGPHSALVADGVVRALSVAGQEVWRRQLPGLRPSARLAHGTGGDETYVGDIDSDGRTEVLVDLPVSLDRSRTGALICFEWNGRERWRFEYGRPRSWEGREFGSVYGGHLIRHVHTSGRDYILAVAWHTLWFPTQVVLLDPPTGKAVDEYWHPGGLGQAILADVDADGAEELFLSGINNPGEGLGHGAVVLLDIPFSNAPVRRGALVEFTGGRELAYALLPRPGVCSALGELPAVRSLARGDVGLVAGVTCGNATIYYQLDFTLQVHELRFSDNFEAAHRRLRLQGLIAHDLGQSQKSCLGRVERFDTAPDGNGPDLARLWAACE